MPDYVSTGGKWLEIPNPHKAKAEERKRQQETARKPRVFPSVAPRKEVFKKASEIITPIEVIPQVTSKPKIKAKRKGK